jgi:hypothetical protein
VLLPEVLPSSFPNPWTLNVLEVRDSGPARVAPRAGRNTRSALRFENSFRTTVCPGLHVPRTSVAESTWRCIAATNEVHPPHAPQPTTLTPNDTQHFSAGTASLFQPVTMGLPGPALKCRASLSRKKGVDANFHINNNLQRISCSENKILQLSSTEMFFMGLFL